MEIYKDDIAIRSVTTQCVWLKNLLMEMMRNIYWREEKDRSNKAALRNTILWLFAYT
jgi:hypothetical protein